MPNKVRLVSDPVLKKPCDPVDPIAISPHILDPLLEAMNETMKAEGGIGLAANQIGHSLRIFILKREATYDEYINPKILSKKELVDFEGEACLSIPGVSAITKRYRGLELEWTDKNGTKKSEAFEGLKAFAIQHEMDHLDGKLYIDQFGPVKRSLLLGKHIKYLREMRR